MNPPPLTSSQSERLREGVNLFNRGEFFECHEVLEAAWLEAADEQKRLLQGLIQVAVSFYHLRRGNFPGASRLLRAGVEKLAGCASPQPPVDIPELLQELEGLPQRLERGQLPTDWPAPQIRLLTIPSFQERSSSPPAAAHEP